ncbi:hypothetical protein MNB_SV-15-48 [hydrothermal vent metagenome]|uniref:Uncharacterized protein n=1 Tax=hydrothermal vent metagenome TaxID=652676 RepID=A0A1W1EJK5_9ZZZZ
MINNIEFKNLEDMGNIKNVISELFGVTLDISGGWGYDANSSVIINNLDMPINQFLNLFAMVRANMEMNITVDSDNRYSGINVSLEEQKNIDIEDKSYQVVTFKITAMNEKIYKNFITEYKENLNKEEFDLSNHFKRRDESKITRVVDYWFYNLHTK